MIRPVRKEDLEQCLVCARKFYDAAQIEKVAPYDEATIAGLFILSIDDPNRRTFVVEVDGKVVGFVLMVLLPFPFNASVKVAYELAWWVDPDHRRSGAGKALLDAAEAWGREEGATFTQMGALETSDGEAIEAVYRKRGYVLWEKDFLRRL